METLSEKETAEALVVGVVHSAESLTMDQLLTRLPQLRWNEVFHIVDRLSRHGSLILRRRGYDYDVSVPQSLSAVS
jgi:hypothetical protein